MSRWIKEIDGRTVDAAQQGLLGKGLTWLASQGWIECRQDWPTEEIAIVDGEIIRRPAPPATPRYLNKLDLSDKLDALGLWEGVRGYLEAQPNGTRTELERFLLGRGVWENEPQLQALKEQLEPILAERGIELDRLLDECIVKDFGQ